MRFSGAAGAAGVVLALTVAIGAQERGLWPGTAYDPAIPTSTATLGHDFGEEISSPDQIARYLRALAAAAPDRARLVEYARTWEGRPLHLLVIGAPGRIARLDDVAADLRRLADPRTLTPEDADRLVRELPAVTWLMHAVHGNEISSSDAALAEAYHLLAASGDAMVDTILRESLVLIDPLQNPDGRARFLHQHRLGRAATPDGDRLAIEHDEPWPGGRSNHYLFDMNRDWFAQTQPETRGRLAVALRYYPHVVVDLHEMGGDSTYYFAPPADPLNPFITPEQTRWLETFGRANAARFDERGFAYFIREVYDSFYPGYGESWPIFNGAIGMTYEQASARGLVFTRRDESTLTYRDGVVHHFTAAITTAFTAAQNRERLLRDFLEYRRSATRGVGDPVVREYVLLAGADARMTARLAANLAGQGIEVRRVEEAFRLGDRDVPAGSYLVSGLQPSARLVRNLLDPHVPQPEPFVEERDRLRRRRMPDQIYDVTGWSLPALFDVEVVTSTREVDARTTPFTGEEPAAAAPPQATVAYLLPWGADTPALVDDLLRAGVRVRHAPRPFTIGERAFAPGTAIVRVPELDGEARTHFAELVQRHRVEPVPLDSGWVDEGPSLGSGTIAALKAPRIVLAWDAPASSLSAGWARYVLERRFGFEVTAVRVPSIGRLDLDRVDVLVLPAGSYGGAFDSEAVERLRRWMRRGGTLITLGEASRWAAGERVNLLETTTELRGGRPEVEEKEGQKARDAGEPFDYEQAIQPERERPHNTPGAILRVVLDREHWLSSGTDGEIQAIVDGRRVFTPLKLDKGTNVGVYAPRDRLVVGGLAWDEAQDQLARKAFLMYQSVGEGHLIAFAEDPNYRGFTEATQLLFANAVLLGPGY
jgi:hypothetical protein